MTTTRKYLAFDIETAKIIDDASDWRSQRPLGISCAATLLGDSREPTLWHGGDRANPNDRMSREEAAALVRLPGRPNRTGLHPPHLERARVRPRHPRRGIAMLRRVPRTGDRPRGHDVPRLLPARTRRRSRRRRQGHGARREDQGHERRARSRAVGGGEAGGGAAVRRPGRADDAGAGDGLRSLWGASLGRPERQGAFDGVADRDG